MNDNGTDAQRFARHRQFRYHHATDVGRVGARTDTEALTTSGVVWATSASSYLAELDATPCCAPQPGLLLLSPLFLFFGSFDGEAGAAADGDAVVLRRVGSLEVAGLVFGATDRNASRCATANSSCSKAGDIKSSAFLLSRYVFATVRHCATALATSPAIFLASSLVNPNFAATEKTSVIDGVVSVLSMAVL